MSKQKLAFQTQDDATGQPQQGLASDVLALKHVLGPRAVCQESRRLGGHRVKGPSVVREKLTENAGRPGPAAGLVTGILRLRHQQIIEALKRASDNCE